MTSVHRNLGTFEQSGQSGADFDDVRALVSRTEASEAALPEKRGLRAVPVPGPSTLPGVLVEAKLHAPSLRRGEWVERRELVSALADTAVKLVVIAASAGSGKTTLAAQWGASSAENRPFAWVSLDRADNDPGVLWWYIVHALRRARPGLAGDEVLRAFRAPVPDITGEVIPLLVNELTAVGEPVVLVLDNYQLINEPSCHQQIEFLLLNQPPSVEVVLITRTSPPLPLARERAAGELVEIGMRELRFTAAEAAALVRNVSGVEPAQPDLALLLDRTEGWPAGLYLAALSLRDHPAPGAFIRQFTGDNRFIVDFLAEEVLSQQPGDIRRFLTRTAILDRFSAPLGGAVAESADAARIIDVLERENLFVVPLDENHQWYRYHYLFAQSLRGELARTEPDSVPALHERASAWHRRSGSTDEAIGHALAAGDITAAVDLITRHWLGYVNSGRATTLLGWVRSLDDDQVAAHPLAAHSAAWVAALSGDRESVRRWIPVIRAGHHDGPLPDGMRSLEFSAALLSGLFGFDGIRAMRESAAQAVELEPDPKSPWYPLAQTALGFSLFLSAEPGAAQALDKAVMNEESVPLVRTAALSAASLVAAEEGNLARAKELANAARRIADDAGLGQPPQYSLARVAAGAVYLLEGRRAEARAEFERSLWSRDLWPGLSPWPTLEGLLRFASLLLDIGDRPAAVPLLNQARSILTALPDGAEAQLARLERLQQRITTTQPPVISLSDPLTERELAVLRLLGEPLSLREIGQQLHLSKNTIKTHVQAIYRKLGVSTRQAAVGKSHGD
jgi:LuxR family transcriptional regulator, maltose regulon positive regulatory protein